jgi:hypothetical protein
LFWPILLRTDDEGPEVGEYAIRDVLSEPGIKLARWRNDEYDRLWREA